MNEAARLAVAAAGGAPRRIYMNCSGKHAGMLDRLRRPGLADRRLPGTDHPLQRRVADVVARLSGEAPAAVGIDGCGAPLFAISLVALARGFGAVNAAAPRHRERQVADAMRAYPEMVGGTGREDTRLMRAFPGLLVKGGAEGVHCAALPDGRCVAVKITDGGDRARMPVLVAALRSLGVGDRRPRRQRPCWTSWVRVVLGGGEPVGTVGSRARSASESPCGTVGIRHHDAPPRTGRPAVGTRDRRVGVGSSTHRACTVESTKHT